MKKLLTVFLTLCMTCALLTGCMYDDINAAIHDDGSGSVKVVLAFADELMDEDSQSMIDEMNRDLAQEGVSFAPMTIDGDEYTGVEKEEDFSSPEEFNALFSGEDSGALASAASNPAMPGVLSMKKNADGSLTLDLKLTSGGSDGESEEDGENTQEDEAAQAISAALESLEQNDEGVGEEKELTPEEQAAKEKELEEQLEQLTRMLGKMHIAFTFRFDSPVRQIAGAGKGVTVSGGTVIINVMEAGQGSYRFTTSRESVAKLLNVQPSPQRLTVDGEEKSAEIYNIDGSNYFKLRDLAMLLSGTEAQFAVGYDKAENRITVETGSAYTANGSELKAGGNKSDSCVVSAQTLTVDGLPCGLTAYNLGGNNFFRLRDLGEQLDFAVDYDAATDTAMILTK